MAKEMFLIIPRDVEDGHRIIEKIYSQLCIISTLSGKHVLIPSVNYRKMPIQEMIGKEILPVGFSGEEITLLSMYCNDELNISNSISNVLTLPIPFIKDSNIYKYQDIAKNLSNSDKWLLQIVDFFSFLTEVGYKISHDNIEPDDFLYRPDTSVKYFIGFNNLKYLKRTDKESIIEHNLKSLAFLLNKFYLQDTEKFDARLYQEKWFGKIEGRLIEPLLYNKYSAITYNSFSEIEEDLIGELKTKTQKKNIGVFLDVANMLTPMYTEYSRMEIDFNKLFQSIFGKKDARNIIKKVAVVFLPEYQGQVFKEDKYDLIFDIKDYLESYGFEILTVENKTAAAKINIDGEFIDTDDNKLIEVMEKAFNELDSVLLLTGDKHFINIARKYRDYGKKIRLISVSEENTSKTIEKEFDHQFIYQYWDCINFI